MTTYRVTEFTSPSPEKIADACVKIRAIVATAGAEKIDVVDMGEGKGLVIARYDTKAKMEAATGANKEAFGELIGMGVVNADGIASRAGDTTFSF